jgi:hypothetical protein
LRSGNVGSNTATDHITVLTHDLQQSPDHYRYSSPILIRSDSAGSSHAFLAHIRSPRRHGLHTEFPLAIHDGVAADDRLGKAAGALTVGGRP